MCNKQLRNIGIIAHVDAGKTTTTERILFYAGKNHRIGEVHDGNTTMDYDPQERRRGITINSAATSVTWREHQINVIDTPGHIDFNVEVNRSLRVLDGAVVVFDGVAGVEPQTETNWRLADKYSVPRLCFINKLDRTGADFFRVLQMLRQRLNIRPLVLQLPLGAEADFHGVIDLLQMQALVWNSEQAGAGYAVQAIPAALLAQAREARRELMETALEQDDAALLAYLDGVEPEAEVLRACIRRACISGAAVPVLAGSAFKNKGVEPLLDAIVDYLPAPHEKPGQDSALDFAGAAEAAPLAALAFKIVQHEHGMLTFVRIYRGQLQAGDVLINARTGKRERISRLYEMHADKKSELALAGPGAIVALAGLKDTGTGDTLCAAEAILQLEAISLAEPVLEVALEARQGSAQQALSQALQAVLREDPSLRLRQDAESGQIILAGMGELQLEVTLEKLRAAHGVEVQLGAPRVAYRETISHAAQVQYQHKKQTGGPGQFAQVVLQVQPLPRGSGVQFVNRISGGAIPREFIPAVETGVRRAAQSGVVAGFAVVDIEVTLLDGAFHERDSSALAFELAAGQALHAALRQAGAIVLEPVMAVEVSTPAACIGDCIGDLNRRRGLVKAQQANGEQAQIEAHVPLQQMFGYIGQLRALSSGRANFTMQFDHYAQVPTSVLAQLQA